LASHIIINAIGIDTGTGTGTCIHGADWDVSKVEDMERIRLSSLSY